MAEGESRSNKEAVFLRLIAFISFMVALCACAALIVLILTEKERTTATAISKQSSTPQCSVCHHRDSIGEADPSPFQELTEQELLAVQRFLENQTQLRLVDESSVKDVKSSYIVYIDLMPPKKDEALAYLAKTQPNRPARQAKVVIAHGDLTPPVIREYIVGDLPTPSWLRVYENTSYRRHVIPFNLRMMTSFEETYCDEVIKPAVDAELRDLMIESFGSTFTDCHQREYCLHMAFSFPDELHLKGRYYWWFAIHDVLGYYHHLLGFAVEVNATSLDHTEWTIMRAFYNGRSFDSLQDLKTEYAMGKLNISKVEYPKGSTVFSDMLRHGSDDRYSAILAPPTFVEPEGRRFKVAGRRIEYRGWSFDLSVDITHGPRLMYVHFREDSIAYEISVQEACVFYGGNNPFAWTSFYYDTAELMGFVSSPLAKGVDCPNTAVYFDLTFFKNRLHRIPHSLCLFEHNAGIPLRRHFVHDGGRYAYGGMTDSYLVLRSIATLVNYDYIFDFIFRVNGVIEIRLSATGYPQATFAANNEIKYGGLLNSPFTLANVHQHLFNVKVDFDILGRKNRFATYDFEQEQIDMSTNGQTLTQYAFNHADKKTEKEAAIQFDFDKPKYYVVYNENAANSNGYKRGYRILNQGMIKRLLPDDSGAKGSAWSKYQIATTVYKDNERTSSHHYNSAETNDPIVDFDKFLSDDEDIVDEDLVSWISMGVFHLPSAEDSPLTTTTGNQISVFLKPFNFFDECPSMQSRDAIFINYDGRTELNGIKRNVSCMPKAVSFGYD